MKKALLSVSVAVAVAISSLAAHDREAQRDGIPALDHAFVVVLENHVIRNLNLGVSDDDSP